LKAKSGITVYPIYHCAF